MADPLVLTLALDPEAQHVLDALRRRWFPSARNHLAAHVTLFHALPGAEVMRVRTTMAEVVRERPALGVTVSAVRRLGRGVALDLDVPGLDAVHRALAEPFRSALTRQDAQRLRPHVTVANKLDPDAARELADELGRSFEPWSTAATGLELWWYRGGPWEHVSSAAFTTDRT